MIGSGVLGGFYCKIIIIIIIKQSKNNNNYYLLVTESKVWKYIGFGVTGGILLLRNINNNKIHFILKEKNENKLDQVIRCV